MPSARFLLALTGAGMLIIPCMPATVLLAAEDNNQQWCSESKRCGGQNSYPTFDLERARRNYLAVARGSKSLAQLSSAEAWELRELLRLMEQNRSANRNGYERCREAQLGDRSGPTELELRLIDLKCSMR